MCGAYDGGELVVMALDGVDFVHKFASVLLISFILTKNHVGI